MTSCKATETRFLAIIALRGFIIKGFQAQEARAFIQLFFNTEKLVIFGDAVRA